MRLFMLVSIALFTLEARADPPNFTDVDADEVLRLCLPTASDTRHEPYATCHAMLSERYKALEPDHADTSHGIILLTHHELGAWRRVVARKYAEMIAEHMGEGDPYHRRQVAALQAMQTAFPGWAQTRCTLAAARNGGGYDTLDALICEAYLTAQHYADLSDPDAVLGCFDCQ